MNIASHSQLAAFIWSVADLLRGDFKQSDYGRVILPFTLLRRLEGVLAPSKDAVLRVFKDNPDLPEPVVVKLAERASGEQFFNASPLSLMTLSETQVAEDLLTYVNAFSVHAREIFEYFNFEERVQQLASSNLLYQVVRRFAGVDLSPERISNFEMGLVFEELIRRFAESSNETAGEHFTPRDIVHLTTSLVLTGQEEKLKRGSIVTIYDPTAGTGGFLSESDAYVKEVTEGVSVSLLGQELNKESYAICKADMLIKGQEVSNIKLGNTLTNDQLPELNADFLLSNPPFGVNWKRVEKEVKDEHARLGFNGRFGPGLPRVSDGSLLFLLHLVSKMRDPRQGGSKIGIILNGSPLFTGGAGSGESEIRRYLLENDLVEAIIGLPTDMFYNTGIATYVWILNNNKPAERQGLVQLIDGSEHHTAMRRSLGSKRRYISDEQAAELVKLYGDFEETPISKIFPTTAFGYRRITVEQPLRLSFQVTSERISAAMDEKPIQRLKPAEREQIEAALNSMTGSAVHKNREQFSKELRQALTKHAIKAGAPVLRALLNAFSERDATADVCKTRGKPEADTDLRDFENVPLTESVEEYFEREVKPHVPEAWIDTSKTDPQDEKVGIVGYEIPFNRHFYVFTPPRSLEEIDRDLKISTDKIKRMIEELAE